MKTRPTQSEPWDDERLAAAFAARATRAGTAGDLAVATSAALRTRPDSALAWRRLLAAAAVVILAVGAVSGGIALVGEPRGSSGVVEFVDGPSADVKTLDARDFAFEYPADWLGYDSYAPGPDLSSVAVLGTVPVAARCGDERHVDVRCVNERPLQPGEIRMNVSTGKALNWSFADRPDIGNGTTRRLQVAGRAAILDVDAGGNAYYGADQSLHLYVERPGEGTEFVMIDLIARDHPADAIEAFMQQVIRSFWFPTAAPEPSDPWAGRSAVGLPVMAVADAIQIRDAGDHDREIAVHGWFSEIGPMSCPHTPATSPIQPVCADPYVVLLADPESLVTRDADGGFPRREPAGPSIQIDLDDLDGTWRPGLPDLGPAVPVEIVVVGHFDDHRSAACPPDLEAACRDRFVVDRVHMLNGEEQPTSLVDLVKEGVGRPFDEARRVIDAGRPEVAILSATHVDGSDLRRIEPILADRRGGLVQEQAVWIVRALDLGALATYVSVDSTGDLYEVTPDGAALMTPITGRRTPDPPPSASPEVISAFTFELTSPEDEPVPIDVLDSTGYLDAARAASAEEIDGLWEMARPGVLKLENLAPDTILVRWNGSVCDVRPQLTIRSGLPDGRPRVLRLTGDRPPCDAIVVRRGIVLRLSTDTRAGDLIGVDETTVTFTIID